MKGKKEKIKGISGNSRPKMCESHAKYLKLDRSALDIYNNYCNKNEISTSSYAGSRNFQTGGWPLWQNSGGL